MRPTRPKSLALLSLHLNPHTSLILPALRHRIGGTAKRVFTGTHNWTIRTLVPIPRVPSSRNCAGDSVVEHMYYTKKDKGSGKRNWRKWNSFSAGLFGIGRKELLGNMLRL